MDTPSSGWEVVIGLEVHAQISTNSKMYCACPVVNTPDPAEMNRYVCPVCLGHPGTLPRPNHQAVVRALALAHKAGSEVAERNVFARKNYFYPDLPKGYQISQFDLPLARGGSLPFWHNGVDKQARLVRMHLEEDTAKLFHQQQAGSANGSDKGVIAGSDALLDFNRAGVPLLEIVTEPDFRSAEECVSFLEELRTLLQRLEISDAAMEAGNFRCEPNVSVRPAGSVELRTKTELKNLNSFTKLRRAVESEVARQIELYQAGGFVTQATMRYDQALGATVQMRIKETADDYRYFDDPDIPPLLISRALHEEATAFEADSAFEERSKLVTVNGLPHEHAATIAGDEELRRFYLLSIADGHEPHEVAKWVVGDLTRLMREEPLRMEPGELSSVLRMMEQRELTLMQAREVFEESYRSGKSARVIVDEKQYGGPQTVDELRSECMEAIEANPKIVADIRGGKISALQVLIGHVMRSTRGSADAGAARATLIELLGIEES